jgi:hypothetical protein
MHKRQSDFAYWQTQPSATRRAVLEHIRQEYQRWEYDVQPRFQRVYRIVKLKPRKQRIGGTMPLYLITKPMTAYLRVDCKDEEEARAWGNRIVAGLEDEDGKPIPPDAVYDFEADCYFATITVELVEGVSAEHAA